MILNEFDAYQEALKKINLNEEVMPIYKGRILTENVDIYCKIQKLLGCNAFEGAHRWLYDLDIENLDESECSKVCNLYQLGIDRGYIDDDTAVEDPNVGAELSAAPSSDEQAIAPAADIPVADAPAAETPAPAPAVPMAAYTVVYSAMRDGQIKTGEAYSNSLNTRSAKADVISKLEKAGYQNISILAIEAGDPDMTGCDNTFCKQSDYVPPAYEDEKEDEVKEADDREPLAHAFDEIGVKASTANTIGQDAVEMTLTEDEAKAEVKKAFDAVNKEFGDNDIEKEKTKKWLDDNKETLDKIRSSLKPEDAKNLDVITKALQSFADGKIAEAEDEEVDEAKKPSSGIKTVLRGLFKILCTLVSLSGSAVGLSGKLITWAGSIISAGADKVNLMLKDSEEEKQVSEAGDDEESDSEDEEKAEEETKDDASSDAEADSTDEKDDKKEEDAEEPDEKLKDDKKEEDGKEDATDDKEEKELSAQEKTQLKDSYKKAFKAAMQKCKYFDKSFDDLTLEEKVKFFETIDDAWGNKADPTKFMSDKETEQLQKITIKK